MWKNFKQTASSNIVESLRHCLEQPRKIRRIPWRSSKTSRWFTITKVFNHLKEEGERDPIFINLANVFMNLQQYAETVWSSIANLPKNQAALEGYKWKVASVFSLDQINSFMKMPNLWKISRSLDITVLLNFCNVMARNCIFYIM